MNSKESFNEETKRISSFYKDCFREKWFLKIKKENFGSPDCLLRPELIFIEMEIEEIIESYSKCFGVGSIENNGCSFVLYENQERPGLDYFIFHDGQEKASWNGNCFSDAIFSRKQFMILKEGLISAFRYRYENGGKYDTITGTCFMTKNRVNHPIIMFNYDNVLHLSYLKGKSLYVSLNYPQPYGNLLYLGLRPIRLTYPC